MAPNVEWHPGVIPEPGVEQLHSRPSHKILDDGGDQHSHQVGLEPVLPDGLNEQQGSYYAKAVNGTERPKEEAPIHKLTGFAGCKGYFAAPAYEAVDEKGP